MQVCNINFHEEVTQVVGLNKTVCHTVDMIYDCFSLGSLQGSTFQYGRHTQQNQHCKVFLHHCMQTVTFSQSQPTSPCCSKYSRMVFDTSRLGLIILTFNINSHRSTNTDQEHLTWARSAQVVPHKTWLLSLMGTSVIDDLLSHQSSLQIHPGRNANFRLFLVQCYDLWWR